MPRKKVFFNNSVFSGSDEDDDDDDDETLSRQTSPQTSQQPARVIDGVNKKSTDSQNYKNADVNTLVQIIFEKLSKENRVDKWTASREGLLDFLQKIENYESRGFRSVGDGASSFTQGRNVNNDVDQDPEIQSRQRPLFVERRRSQSRQRTNTIGNDSLVISRLVFPKIDLDIPFVHNGSDYLIPKEVVGSKTASFVANTAAALGMDLDRVYRTKGTTSLMLEYGMNKNLDANSKVDDEYSFKLHASQQRFTNHPVATASVYDLFKVIPLEGEPTGKLPEMSRYDRFWMDGFFNIACDRTLAEAVIERLRSQGFDRRLLTEHGSGTYMDRIQTAEDEIKAACGEEHKMIPRNAWIYNIFVNREGSDTFHENIGEAWDFFLQEQIDALDEDNDGKLKKLSDSTKDVVFEHREGIAPVIMEAAAAAAAAAAAPAAPAAAPDGDAQDDGDDAFENFVAEKITEFEKTRLYDCPVSVKMLLIAGGYNFEKVKVWHAADAISRTVVQVCPIARVRDILWHVLFQNYPFRKKNNTKGNRRQVTEATEALNILLSQVVLPKKTPQPTDGAQAGENNPQPANGAEGWNLNDLKIFYEEAMRAIRLGKTKFFQSFLNRDDSFRGVHGIQNSLMCMDRNYRMNFTRLCSAMSEERRSKEPIVSSRSLRARQSAVDKREALYFFQKLCGVETKIDSQFLR